MTQKTARKSMRILAKYCSNFPCLASVDYCCKEMKQAIKDGFIHIFFNSRDGCQCCIEKTHSYHISGGMWGHSDTGVDTSYLDIKRCPFCGVSIKIQVEVAHNQTYQEVSNEYSRS